MPEACSKRGGLTEVPTEDQEPNPRIAFAQRLQTSATSVGRSVIHIDQLVRQPHMRHRSGDLAMQLIQIVQFVKNRNYDGYVHQVSLTAVPYRDQAP